ncbi:MAG: hypothetical protein ACI38A_05860 [Candidatus Ornithomonoglobus sp.]
MRRLNDLHMQAIFLLVEGRLTRSEIADTIGKSRSCLYKWLDEPVFKEELELRTAEREAANKRRITALAKKALDRQEKILDSSDDDRSAAAVASDILDRAGYPKIKPGKPDSGKDDKRTGVIILPPVNMEEGSVE